MKNYTFHIRRITVSAVFLSIALVVKTIFSIQIPLFGQDGMRVGISGIFSIMPAILFGPVYGGVTAGIIDVLGYILKPTGPYMPLMTLIVVLGGVVQGFLWRLLRDRNSGRIRIGATVFSVMMLVWGICNVWFLSADGVNKSFYDRVPAGEAKTDGMHLISKMLIERTAGTKDPSANLETYITFMTAGVLGSAVLGLVLLVADLLISKKFLKASNTGQTMPLLIMMLLSGLLVTTLNTILMRETLFESWKLLPFSVVWIPRVIEEILGNTVKAYFVSILLGVYNRQKALNVLIK